MNKPIVLSFDLGRKGAWYISNYKYGEEVKMCSLVKLEKLVKDLTELYKPDIIQYPPPVRHRNTMALHFQFIGVINLIAEKKGIKIVKIADNHAKAVVLKNGRAKKEDVMKHFKQKSEHLADAMMFNECFLIEYNDK